jgi:DNA-binding beta-propeller fold protein YncE
VIKKSLLILLVLFGIFFSGCDCEEGEPHGAFGPRCSDEFVDDSGTGGSGTGTLLVSDLADFSIRRFTGVTGLDGETVTDPPVTGSLTRLTRPKYLFIHPVTNELIVPDEGTSAILFFSDPAEIEGNAPPSRLLFGVGTELLGPVQVYVDSSTDELYVLDRATSQILVYSDASTIDGEVAPNRRIVGGLTGLSGPSAFFFQPATEQLSVLNPTEILTFEAYRSANGGPAPSGRVRGANTTFSNLAYGELTGSGTLILADSGTNQILSFDSWVFDRTDEAPTRILGGNNTGLSEPRQFALLDDTLYIADEGRVLVFDEISTSQGNPFPSRRFSGLNPNSQTLQGLVFP